MSCNFITQIPRDECIGDSRIRINDNFTALNAAVCSLSAASLNPDSFVLKSGDAMSGNLILPSNNSPSNSHAVRRDYVDTNDALRVSKAGDAMSGPLTLHANPINVMHAVPKQYVDGGMCKAWWRGVIGPVTTPGGPADVLSSYNCSAIKYGWYTIKLTFNVPFSTRDSYVWSWSAAESGFAHHVVAESLDATNNNYDLTRTNEYVILGLYEEGQVMARSAHTVNVMFFGS
jgi:hypothetical protein